MSRRRRQRRQPASSRLTSSNKRGSLDGRVGEGTPKASRRAALVPLMSRLRRLEVLMLHLAGRLKLPEGEFDKLVQRVVDLHSDTQDVVDGTES